jgi:hypothetical protein
MATSGGLILGLIFFIVGICLFFFGLLSFKRKRLIENIPTSKIRAIAMGLVEIFGEVVPYNKNVLKSPFSQMDCVYYTYTIEELRSSGKHSHWVTIKKGWDYRLFYLKDDTGIVLVDPRDAKIDIPADNVFESSLFKDPPEMVKQFLHTGGILFEGALFGINKTMQYTERFIALKDKLYILGTATDNPLVEERTAQKGVEDIIIKKGIHEKLYYISDKTERDILRQYTIRLAIGFSIGSILIILGLLYLI